MGLWGQKLRHLPRLPPLVGHELQFLLPHQTIWLVSPQLFTSICFSWWEFWVELWVCLISGTESWLKRKTWAIVGSSEILSVRIHSPWQLKIPTIFSLVLKACCSVLVLLYPYTLTPNTDLDNAPKKKA